MSDTLAANRWDISVPEENIHALVTVMGDEDVRAVLDEVMSRSKSKYTPFLLEIADKLGADSLYAGCKTTVRNHDGTHEYGIGFYKDGQFLGHVPFERKFLGMEWHAKHIEGNPLMRFFQMLSVASEPRFVANDRYRYSCFSQGPKLEFRVKQPHQVTEAPYKIDPESQIKTQNLSQA
jgi:hypothetical protein